jgi:UDP-glucose 4-epimerase
MNGATMKTIVTGGAGFIGSHLVGQLLDLGHEVTVLDDFSTGRRENLASYADASGLQVVHADVTDFEAIQAHFRGAAWIFHLAALAEVLPSIQQPREYFRTNLMGTINVLEAARLGGVKRFIYAASSSCYGIPDDFPTSENSPLRPQHPYALAKQQGEAAALHWHQVYKLPLVSLRLFNVFGPRMNKSGRYGAVFGIFLAQKLAGKPFTVVGDGSQTRDFLFVSDAARAFVMAAQSELAGEVLNVGSGKSQSIQRITELLGGDIVRIPRRPGEPDCSQADISKIEALLGWHAQVSFEDGLALLLREIEEWKDAPVWTPEDLAEMTRDWFKFMR